MITEGDLLESELMDMFKRVKKSEMDLNKVEEEGFVALYKAIDSLFEEDGNDDNTAGARQFSRKEELLDAIADLQGEGVLQCGLEATELKQREILSIVEMVENRFDPSRVRSHRRNSAELGSCSTRALRPGSSTRV
jgi:hypothetical protein